MWKRGQQSPLGIGRLAFILVVVVVFAGTLVLYGSDDQSIPENVEIGKIAESQLGNMGGKKFWKWYGYDEGVDWCGCFVSWCAEQCGYIETNKAPKFSCCQDGVNWFISHKRWFSKTISPQPGMIIFFDWDENGISDHVGIVKECKDDIVYTIEGNSQDMCKEMTYKAGSKGILGYGLIEDC
jgi:hypothetical protein